MSAQFYNVTILHYDNLVRIHDGLEPVGNNKACPAPHKLVEGFLNLLLCSRIYA